MAARCVSAQPVAPTCKAMPPQSRSRCVSYGVLRPAAPVATADSISTILAKLLREQIDGLLALAGGVPRSVAGKRRDRRLVGNACGVGIGHAIVNVQDEILRAIRAVLGDVIVL